MPVPHTTRIRTPRVLIHLREAKDLLPIFKRGKQDSLGSYLSLFRNKSFAENVFVSPLKDPFTNACRKWLAMLLKPPSDNANKWMRNGYFLPVSQNCRKKLAPVKSDFNCCSKQNHWKRSHPTHLQNLENSNRWFHTPHNQKQLTHVYIIFILPIL